jgi:hypothetical protein
VVAARTVGRIWRQRIRRRGMGPADTTAATDIQPTSDITEAITGVAGIDTKSFA